jgi:hypothetical protein
MTTLAGRRRLPSQHHRHYRHGCTPANRHCERCRPGPCGQPYHDYRRNFDYPWYPPYHRAMIEDTPDDITPRIIHIDGPPVIDDAPLPYEEVPPPNLPAPGDDSSPSDRRIPKR